MTARLKFWSVGLLLAALVGLAAMLAVIAGAEPAALYLVHSLGSHPASPVLMPDEVSQMSHWIGLIAFLGVISMAIDADRPKRRHRW